MDGVPDRLKAGRFRQVQVLITYVAANSTVEKIMQTNITFEDYNDFEIISGSCVCKFPLHFHRSDCFITLTGGNAVVDNGLQKTILMPSQSLYIPAFTPHLLAPADGRPYTYTTLCIKREHGRVFDPNCDARLQRAEKFISAHSSQKLKLDIIAKYSYVSKFNLVRRFKAQFGLTPYQYHTNIKVAELRRGLRHKQPLADLAYMLGFTDQSHMCNVFKKYMGVSPVKYQKAYTCYSNAGENVAKM